MTNKSQQEEKMPKHGDAAKGNATDPKKNMKEGANEETAEIEETESDKENKTSIKDDDKKAGKDKKKNRKKSKEDESQEKIQELGEQLEKLNDRHLRLQAEFDNYRKRTLKERIELIKNAGEETLTGLLTVIDDMDRAVANVDSAKDITAIKQGLNLIDLKLKEFLKSKGVLEIEALHNEFDTDLHEAITKTPVEEDELKGKIVDVIQKGYKLNDKVIRFAKVVIGE